MRYSILDSLKSVTDGMGGLLYASPLYPFGIFRYFIKMLFDTWEKKFRIATVVKKFH